MSKWCFRYFKDTILKANHNHYQIEDGPRVVFPIFQRYNFESKSQLVVVANLTNRRCFRYFKDTILKANHNYIYNKTLSDMVFPIFQRYNFESKSQQMRRIK